MNTHGAYRVGNFDKGENVGVISAAWAKYGPHEKYISLTELLKAEAALYNRSRENVISNDDIRRLRAVPLQDGQMCLETPRGELIQFTNWGYNQTCNFLGAQPKSLARYPAALASQCLNHDIERYAGESEKGLTLLTARQNGSDILRATTSLTYSRFHNYEIIKDLIDVVGDGTGRNGSFKIPGRLNWQAMTMNPWAQGDRSDSTIYRAEDGREMLIFLCEDANPVEIPGVRLPDGSPDMYFRGFIVRNSDVGASKFEVMWFYLRGVCANRNLWGVTSVESFSIKHTKNAKLAFLREFEPSLARAMGADASDFINAMKVAATIRIAKTDEEAVEFLYKKMKGKIGSGLTLKNSTRVVSIHQDEERRPLRTVYDAVQGITAFARREKDQSLRMDTEKVAVKLLAKAAA